MTDDIAALASAAQKFIERYQTLERPSAVVTAMQADIDAAIADGIDYQTPLVSGIYQLCTRWPDAAHDAAAIRTLADSYATFLAALTSRDPKPWLDDGQRLWSHFTEAQSALLARAAQLDSVATAKPPSYGAWHDGKRRGG